MALIDTVWYINFGNGSSTGYYAVPVWSNKTAVAGDIIRQATTPAENSERCFICTTAGAAGAVEPTWTVTRGALNTSSSAVYQECSGIAALNGDVTNTPFWASFTSAAVTLGQVVKRANAASYWICTIAGTAGGTEPTWANDTAGTTRTDSGATWTCLGVVGNFTGWQAPHARLINAFAATWGAAGNSFYVASEHAETSTSSLIYTIPGSLTSPGYVISVNKTNVPPTSANIATGASVSTTGAKNMTIAGLRSYVDSVTFSAGNLSSSAGLFLTGTVNQEARFINCIFKIINTATSSKIYLSSQSVFNLVCINCSWLFSSVSQTIYYNVVASSTTQIIGGSMAASGSVPTILITRACGNVMLDGVDLSTLGSGKTLVGADTTNGNVTIKNCKLGSTVTKATTPSLPHQKVVFIESDSSNTNYLVSQYHYAGSQVIETTIVRTGGATDGTTAVSWNIATTANSFWAFPYESLPIAIWNAIVAGTITVTVYGIWGGGAVPNKDDIWIEAKYIGDANFPIDTIVNSSKANSLATIGGCDTDASSWGGSTTPFAMSLTLSPRMAGPIYIVVKAAKSGSTFYIDPKAVIS